MNRQHWSSGSYRNCSHYSQCQSFDNATVTNSSVVGWLILFSLEN